MSYEVYLYTLPRISGDNKSIPGPDSQRQEFVTVDEARTFASEHKDKFDRVILIQTSDDGQKMLERYMDGKEA